MSQLYGSVVQVPECSIDLLLNIKFLKYRISRTFFVMEKPYLVNYRIIVAFKWALTFVLIVNSIRCSDAKNFSIGVAFDEERSELFEAFNFAMAELENYTLDEHNFKSLLEPYVNFVPRHADSCGIATAVQQGLLQHGGTLAIICAMSDPKQVFSFLSQIHALSIPYIAPQIPQSLVGQDVGFGLRLQPMGMQDAILALVNHYDYNRFIYLYCGYEGIHGLQAFHDRMNAGSDSVRIAVAKKFSNTAEALEILQQIETSYRWIFKLIVLDCPMALAKKVILGHVADRGLGRRTYQYLISGFAFDEYWDPDDLLKASYLNVSGFRIVNPDRPYVQKYLRNMADYQNRTEIKPPILTANGAFLYDCLLVFQEAISRAFSKDNSTQSYGKTVRLALKAAQSHSQSPHLNAVHVQHRNELIQALRKVRVEGLTGWIQFSKRGARINYALDVMEVSIRGEIEKIGEWNDADGFIPLKEEEEEEERRPFVVTSLLDDPYLIKRSVEPGQPELEGNDRYDGFVKDFMELISAKLNFSYVIQITKDGKHGQRDDSLVGGWNGMVGELVRHEADLAVGALTVNADREIAIHLSKPFMFMGISIMLYKPNMQNGGMTYDTFEFMRPLSRDTWVCVGIAYIGVCIVLYVIARFNQKELLQIEKRGLVKLRTQFSASNSLWFTFASLVSQGTNICPRSLACRIVGSVWWFFTLILISSYTANFAAFQTVNRMVQPINSVSDLIASKKVTYGLMAGGATEDFFRKSRVHDYQKMHAFMSSTKGANAKSYDEGIARVRREKGSYAFLLESLKNDYVNRRMPCDTMRVAGNLDMHSFAIGLSKKTILRVEDISRIILELRGSGAVDYIQNKWWPLINECEGLDDIPKEERGRLSVAKLMGVFYLLIGGVVLALFVAGVEIWMKARSNAKVRANEASSSEKSKCFSASCIGVKFSSLGKTDSSM